jgi:hypothetical protein
VIDVRNNILFNTQTRFRSFLCDRNGRCDDCHMTSNNFYASGNSRSLHTGTPKWGFA